MLEKLKIRLRKIKHNLNKEIPTEDNFKVGFMFGIGFSVAVSHLFRNILEVW